MIASEHGPPFADEAIEQERILLGSILLKPSEIIRISNLDRSDFYDSDVGKAVEHIRRLALSSFPVNDTSLLVQNLRDAQLLDGIGGMQGYAELSTTVPNHAHMIYYAENVAKYARVRRLWDVSFTLRHECSQADVEPSTVAAKAIRSIEESVTDGLGDSSSLSDMINEELQAIQDASRARRPLGLKVGLPTLDEHTGGLQEDLVILAARPSVGKTALGLHIACNVAEQDKQVLFFSLEMSQRDIAQRLLSRQTGISVQRIRQGYLDSNEVAEIDQASAAIKQMPIRPICKPRLTVTQMLALSRSHAANHGLDLVAIDYLGLVKPEGKFGSRYEAITQISNDIAAMTKTLRKPVICLSQLNRGAEDDPPKLDHLRDSGAIEQDADSVWLLDRQRDSVDAKLLIAKARQGAVGKLSLNYDKSRCIFTDPSQSLKWDPNGKHTYQ